MKIRHVDIQNFRGIRRLTWSLNSDFNCLIGPGDSCKTTFLNALDFALAPRVSVAFDDTDFFNLDVSDPIIIQVTLAHWDIGREAVQKLFQESKFGQMKCGLALSGPTPEPSTTEVEALNISLRVDRSLEPKWFVVKGVDQSEEVERRPIYAADRVALGLARLESQSDGQFTWGRNTILTRLGDEGQGAVGGVLSELAREIRNADIAQHQSVADCQTLADSILKSSGAIGALLRNLSPRIDLQKHSIGSGALALHEGQVPIRNKGIGTKKLIGLAMQMSLNEGKSISLIDELETGLEPHRIRGLIYQLKKTGQQVFTTTHSAVVIRELSVEANDLHVCKTDSDGTMSIQSLNIVPNVQGPVRSNAEAFLGTKIIACEGLTEIGLLKAYDNFRIEAEAIPVWSLRTAFMNCGGGSKVRPACESLVALGYRTAFLCDDDAPTQIGPADFAALESIGVLATHWNDNNSTEGQLFAEVPWESMTGLLTLIAHSHDSIELSSIVDLIRTDFVPNGQLGIEIASWPESPHLRKSIGHLAHKGGWIKRTDYAEKAFRFVLPLLPTTGVMATKLTALWKWIQNE